MPSTVIPLLEWHYNQWVSIVTKAKQVRFRELYEAKYF